MTKAKAKRAPKQKLGKKTDEIFTVPSSAKHSALQEKPPSRASQDISKSGRGRPLQHQEGWSKTTVVLLDRQIHWLDSLASDIRLNTKSAISRAEIIRSLIDALQKSGCDISHCSSEETITKTVLGALKGKGPCT